jgi:molybdate transport system substrate-binding protein
VRIRLFGVLAVALAFAMAMALLGCSTAGPSGVSITVAGAASLRDALNAAATRYETTHPSTGVRFTFDASSALRAQIEQGAPVDVFASADTTNPQQLVDHGLATGPVKVIARNELVIVVPRSKSRVATPRDLAAPGVKVIAAGAEVPITKYAVQLVERLARLPGYPPDYAARVDANVVSREDNVRAIVAKLALGEGDAGIVYATDAAAAEVGTVAVPAEPNVVATYGAVVIKSSAQPALANDLVAWLAGPDGQAVLAGFGFLPASR